MVKKNEVAPVEPGAIAVPDFMAADKGMGTEVLSQFVRPPYLKIVKNMSKETKKLFGEGSAVLMPNKQLIVEAGGSFQFVPLFFFVEYCAMNPWQLKDTLPMVRERSFDRDSALARKCRGGPKTWKEPCPEDPEGKLNISNREVLNFIVALKDVELVKQPVVMSFMGGEHKPGRLLSALIQGRNAPLFGCVFRATTALHQYAGDNEDWGLNFENGDPAFVTDPEEYAIYKESHLELTKQHDSGLVDVTYSEPEASDVKDESAANEAAF